jgi:protein farnesyltransferase subunit beta
MFFKLGMRDKPGKSRDFYHSCYSLSGLSVSQNCNISTDINEKPYLAPALVYGDSSNLLKPTSAVYNIGLEKLEFVIKYFQAEQFSNIHSELISMKTL